MVGNPSRAFGTPASNLEGVSEMIHQHNFEKLLALRFIAKLGPRGKHLETTDFAKEFIVCFGCGEVRKIKV